MSFVNLLEKYNQFNFEKFNKNITSDDVKRVIEKDKLDEMDFLILLSDRALNHIEEIAKKASKITTQHFGNVKSLYTPIYLSNYCASNCVYCGFSSSNQIKRKRLTSDEIEKEAKSIAKTGLKHILMLTGEAPKIDDIDYLKEATKILKRYFHFVGMEVYAMDESEYKELFEAGVDGLTIYQETYNREVYKQVHLSGRKKDYLYRLDAAERGAKVGMRQVNIGALFGLSECIEEAFTVGLHAKYLQNKYLETEVAISMPRICSAESDYEVKYELNDQRFVQFMMAFRLFLPRVSINISTRENPNFRENILPLGVTKISAGSKTEVAGHTQEGESTKQFEISDSRSVSEIIEALNQKGYQPILKDWEGI